MRAVFAKRCQARRRGCQRVRIKAPGPSSRRDNTENLVSLSTEAFFFVDGSGSNVNGKTDTANYDSFTPRRRICDRTHLCERTLSILSPAAAGMCAESSACLLSEELLALTQPSFSLVASY